MPLSEAVGFDWIIRLWKWLTDLVLSRKAQRLKCSNALQRLHLVLRNHEKTLTDLEGYIRKNIRMLRGERGSMVYPGFKPDPGLERAILDSIDSCPFDVNFLSAIERVRTDLPLLVRQLDHGHRITTTLSVPYFEALQMQNQIREFPVSGVVFSTAQYGRGWGESEAPSKERELLGIVELIVANKGYCNTATREVARRIRKLP